MRALARRADEGQARDRHQREKLDVARQSRRRRGRRKREGSNVVGKASKNIGSRGEFAASLWVVEGNDRRRRRGESSSGTLAAFPSSCRCSSSIRPNSRDHPRRAIGTTTGTTAAARSRAVSILRVHRLRSSSRPRQSLPSVPSRNPRRSPPRRSSLVVGQRTRSPPSQLSTKRATNKLSIVADAPKPRDPKPEETPLPFVSLATRRFAAAERARAFRRSPIFCRKRAAIVVHRSEGTTSRARGGGMPIPMPVATTTTTIAFATSRILFYRRPKSHQGPNGGLVVTSGARNRERGGRMITARSSRRACWLISWELVPRVSRTFLRSMYLLTLPTTTRTTMTRAATALSASHAARSGTFVLLDARRTSWTFFFVEMRRDSAGETSLAIARRRTKNSKWRDNE